MKIVIGGARCNKKRWRAHRGKGNLLVWLWPLFVGFYT